MPYLVFLARCRDYEQPAVIVLLDSDQAGSDAKAKLLKSAPLRSAKLKPEFILQIGDLHWQDGKCPSGLTKAIDIEDLIPVEICVDAVKRYFEEFPSEHGMTLAAFTKELVASKIVDGKSIFYALENACRVTVSPLKVTLQPPQPWLSCGTPHFAISQCSASPAGRTDFGGPSNA